MIKGSDVELCHRDAVQKAEQRADRAGDQQAEHDDEPGVHIRVRVGEQGHGLGGDHGGKARHISDAQVNSRVAGKEHEYQADGADDVVGIRGEHGDDVRHREEIAIQEAHHNADHDQHIHNRQIQGKLLEAVPEPILISQCRIAFELVSI